MIASISGAGLIHVWVTPVVENWNSYAPGFEELEENREFPEHEDEFDIETEEALERRRVMEQDRKIDITFIPTETDFTNAKLDQAYDQFISHDPDGDDNEAFYPPPEFEAECRSTEPRPTGCSSQWLTRVGCAFRRGGGFTAGTELGSARDGAGAGRERVRVGRVGRPRRRPEAGQGRQGGGGAQEEGPEAGKAGKVGGALRRGLG